MPSQNLQSVDEMSDEFHELAKSAPVIELIKTTAVISTKLDSHEKQDEIFFRHIGESIKDVRLDLKKQNYYLTLVIGGLIALSRVPDLVGFLHK